MKIIRFALLAAMLLALGTFGIASAQGGITYSSGFTVQNLSSNTATVVLDFYNQDGSLAGSKGYTIAGNSNKNFYPIADVSDGFNGSLVISSDQDIRAINNLLGSGPGSYFDSTTGFQAGATTVNLPLIMCGNNGFDTWFNVQDTGTSDANITITYTPGLAGTGTSESATIKPGAALTFNQASGSSTKNCSNGLGGKFVGSAQIVSTNGQPIVAAAMQVNSTTAFKVLLGYGGFASGSSTVVLPLVMANNNQFYTSVQVQNIDSADTNVTVTYATNTVSGGQTPVAESFSLPHGTSKTILQSGTPSQSGSNNDWTTLGKYIGGATITDSNGAKLVAVVNQVRASPAIGSAYQGFDPSTATKQISAPLIMANNSTYYTSIQVQNPATTGSVHVNIAYGPNISGGSFNPTAESFDLPAGQIKTILQSGTPAQNGGANNWNGAGKYIGSATISSPDGPIVAIVNQVSLSVSGDQMASYNAFNY